jgi:hypothetical protein
LKSQSYSAPSHPIEIVSRHITPAAADAAVQDAESLAGAMPWVLQVSASIPQNIVPGDLVPIVLTIGGVHSQDRVNNRREVDQIAKVNEPQWFKWHLPPPLDQPAALAHTFYESRSRPFKTYKSIPTIDLASSSD